MAVKFLDKQNAIIERLTQIINDAWQPNLVYLDTPETLKSQNTPSIAFLWLADTEPSEDGSILEECTDLVFEAALRFRKTGGTDTLHKTKREHAEKFRAALTTGRRLEAGGVRYSREWRGETYLLTDAEAREKEAQSDYAMVWVRFVIEGVRSRAF